MKNSFEEKGILVVRLDPEVKILLQDCADRLDITVSDIIRKLVEDYLDTEKG